MSVRHELQHQHPGGIEGALVRGGVPSGLSEDGQATIPLEATSEGELKVATRQEDVTALTLLQLQAIRIGLEMYLDLGTGDLLSMAREEG